MKDNVTDTAPGRAVLLALSPDPQPVTVLAAKAGVSESVTLEALQRLVREHLAIAEGDGYELTGPLSWFGDFGSAVTYFAKRNLVLRSSAEIVSHLYLCDVRIKNARPAGDPLTETASVFACGRTAREVTHACEAPQATCDECRSMAHTGLR